MQEVGRRDVKKVPTLRGRTIINLFFESSTRTRTCFEIAGKRLSADVVNFSPSTSSMTKGETLLDTAQTSTRWTPTPSSCATRSRACRSASPTSWPRRSSTPATARTSTRRRRCSTSSPCREEKGRIDGLTVAIVGDILHTRVARSNIYGFQTLGAEVRLAAPPTLLPGRASRRSARRCYASLREALDGADVVMMLRIQRERLRARFFPSIREYSATFCLDRATLRFAKADAIVMHPGPINRGVEISHDVADRRPGVILDQVRNGVAVRMAVLYLLRRPRPGAPRRGRGAS